MARGRRRGAFQDAAAEEVREEDDSHYAVTDFDEWISHSYKDYKKGFVLFKWDLRDIRRCRDENAQGYVAAELPRVQTYLSELLHGQFEINFNQTFELIGKYMKFGGGD